MEGGRGWGIFQKVIELLRWAEFVSLKPDAAKQRWALGPVRVSEAGVPLYLSAGATRATTPKLRGLGGRSCLLDLGFLI